MNTEDTRRVARNLLQLHATVIDHMVLSNPDKRGRVVVFVVLGTWDFDLLRSAVESAPHSKDRARAGEHYVCEHGVAVLYDLDGFRKLIENAPEPGRTDAIKALDDRPDERAVSVMVTGTHSCLVATFPADESGRVDFGDLLDEETGGLASDDDDDLAGRMLAGCMPDCARGHLLAEMHDLGDLFEQGEIDPADAGLVFVSPDAPQRAAWCGPENRATAERALGSLGASTCAHGDFFVCRRSELTRLAGEHGASEAVLEWVRSAVEEPDSDEDDEAGTVPVLCFFASGLELAFHWPVQDDEESLDEDGPPRPSRPTFH